MIDDDELLTQDGWFAEAQTLVEQWFDLEDPTRLEPAARELYVETEVEGLTLRGYVDRLDVAPDGAMRVVDYKTGRSPSELFEAKALFQMKFYALVLWRIRGEIPRLLQLVYLGNGEVVRYAPDERDLLAIERNIQAIWDADGARRADRRLAARAPPGCATGATSATCAPRGAARLRRCPRAPRAIALDPASLRRRSTPPTSDTEAASSARRRGRHPPQVVDVHGPGDRRAPAPRAARRGSARPRRPPSAPRSASPRWPRSRSASTPSARAAAR